MSKLRLLVCGGRNYGDAAFLNMCMDMIMHKRGIAEICHGGARGADKLAGMWAQDRRIPCRVFPADWNAHGKAAGPKRNQQMLDEWKPDGIVAFPGGSGTADMVRRAKVAGIKVWEPSNG